MKKLIFILILVFISGCTKEYVIIDRETKLPIDIQKVTPEMDVNPVKSHSPEYNDPIPVRGINTVGGEDSPFILPDGNTLYFFFTPDVRVPVEKQIIDGVTGIYVSKKVNGVFGMAGRIFLDEAGKAGSDGCEFVQENLMYFCTVREGYSGVHWFSAEYKEGKWQDWKVADDILKTDKYKTGELHISKDGNELYFHSDRSGGKGNYDIWMSKKINGEWGEPINVAAINTERSDGWPALNPNEDELWITRDYGLWRSKKFNGEWQTPELMFSPLAGEASIDNQGNVYFTHHFYKDDKMIEADIYFASKNY